MICESVKQHYVATYLGIAPESLSRIKKSLKEKSEDDEIMIKMIPSEEKR